MALRIIFDAQFRVGDQTPICTEGTITLDDDGAWFLSIARPGSNIPIINLAGQAATPAGVITETIRASFTSLHDRLERS